MKIDQSTPVQVPLKYILYEDLEYSVRCLSCRKVTWTVKPVSRHHHPIFEKSPIQFELINFPVEDPCKHIQERLEKCAMASPYLTLTENKVPFIVTLPACNFRLNATYDSGKNIRLLTAMLSGCSHSLQSTSDGEFLHWTNSINAFYAQKCFWKITGKDRKRLHQTEFTMYLREVSKHCKWLHV